MGCGFLVVGCGVLDDEAVSKCFKVSLRREVVWGGRWFGEEIDKEREFPFVTHNSHRWVERLG